MLRVRPFDLSATNRRLTRALTVYDLRRIAQKRVPRPVFDYVDGAAESETSVNRARKLFRDLEFSPSILHDVSTVNTSAFVLGSPTALPVSFAPTGFTRLVQHEGERAVARVAESWNIPYALSTMGSTSIEDVELAAPGARRWFQLYMWKDRGASQDLVERAKSAGYDTLIVTVDVPVAGARLRDVRNGFSAPPELSLRTLAHMARHPAWGINLITTPPLKFASLDNWNGSIADLVSQIFDPTVTMRDLDWIRSIWQGPLVVKGIQRAEDAVRVIDAGADAIVLSNHGGRQLDRAAPPLRLLPDVRDAIADRSEVWLDSGIMTGGDIVAAIALGATTTMVGRAYLYGLMAGGERGVDRTLQILSAEIRRTMALLGVQSLAELHASHVRLP